MSARDDETSGGEGFLGRWIKRKADAQRRGEPEQQPREAAPPDAAAQGEKTEEPAFDLSRLPSLDDITAETNLTDFMRKEVPAVLRNAALRRAWALDPAIRDYVNPAREYAYDWNTPGGVPGNGPLEAGFDALKRVATVFSSPAEDHTLGVSEVTGGAPASERSAQADEAPPPSPVRTSDMKVSPQASEKTEIISSDEDLPEEPATPSSEPAPPRRRHGGAAPV